MTPIAQQPLSLSRSITHETRPAALTGPHPGPLDESLPVWWLALEALANPVRTLRPAAVSN